jgi:hypothetical protein
MGNWFDVDMAITVGLVVFTTGLAIVALEATWKPPTPQRVRRYRILTAIFALALIGLTVAQATHTKHTDSKRDGEIRELQGKTDVMRDMLLHPNASDTDKQILIALNKLGVRMGLKQVQVAPDRTIADKAANPAERVVPVTALTTDELRAHAIDWAAKMRNFDHAFQVQRAQKEDNERQEMMANRGRSTEDQRVLWTRHTNEELNDYRQREQDFKQVYLGTLLALRDELVNRYIRVGAVPPKLERGTSTVFEFQSLAGADPIGEAATYLEQLARELPDK